MRSEKEIDDMIAKLSATESPSVSAAAMALMWVRGDDIGGMVQSNIHESVERLKMEIEAALNRGEMPYLKQMPLENVEGGEPITREDWVKAMPASVATLMEKEEQ